MYNSSEDSTSEYEKTINRLSDQITELFSKIHFYQALVAEKELQINQLKNENNQLKTQLHNVTSHLKVSTNSDQEVFAPLPTPTPPVYPTNRSPQKSTLNNSDIDSRTNKRVCPNCGATGFAIREVEDKLHIISYSPRRMYAKKKACTKCKYEW